MNPRQTNAMSAPAPRPLAVAWLESSGPWPLMISRSARPLLCERREPHLSRGSRRPLLPSSPRSRTRSFRAFTILEMMIVVGIIGLIAGLTLPHLSGFTKSNTMTATTRQLLDDVGLARQRAIANRSEVCMVFLPPNFWTNDRLSPGVYSSFSNAQITTLVGHQYSAYALISTRTVGDQPGISNCHYISDWKYLPQGAYIYAWQLTNGPPPLITNLISTTNTTTGSGVSNGWNVTPFDQNILFPFPSTFVANSNYLPYIGFTPGGQLIRGSDEFIAITTGSFLPSTDSNGNPTWTPGQAVTPNFVETPMGQVSNNANLIHIDWLTARARLERNQF